MSVPIETHSERTLASVALDEQMPLGFLATVFAANFLALLNFSTVAVAMMPIDTALGAPQHLTLQLPCALFAAMVCGAPLTPYLLRRWGTKRVLSAAVAGLALTSALAPLCSNIWQLAAVLFLSGLASAPIAAATQAEVDRYLPGAKRGIGMAVWSAGIYASGLLGPLMAGYLLPDYGWQTIFLVPLPIALLTALLIAWFVGPSKPEPVRSDLATLVLAPLTIVFLIGTCSLGRSLGWSQSYVPYMTLTGLLIAAPLYAIQYRRTPAPALDLGCLRDRNVALALLMAFFANLVGTGLFQVEFLGRYSHLSEHVLGLRTTIGTIGLLGGLALAAYLCRAGRAGVALIAAVTFSVISKIGFLFYGEHTGAIAAIWPVLIGGVGFGLMTASLATLAYDTVNPERAADVGTLFVLVIYLGACLGTGALDEVILGLTTLNVGEGMSYAAAKQAAFKAEFWVELGVTLLLLIPAVSLANGARGRMALDRPISSRDMDG